jgi:hypothetical protein
MTISSSAVIVELNISVWTAAKLDRTATDNVISSAQAVNNAAQVRKNLMAGTTLRKEIADYAAGCRMWHNKSTLPWADKGGRLLPTSMFMDYKTEANARRAHFQSLVGTFLAEYPNLVNMAQGHMGALFDANDYPGVQSVEEKFDFRLVFSPVPEAGDFRLDIPKAEMDAIKSDYELNFKDRLGEAMREPWDRLHKMLEHMSEKMAEGVEGGPKKQYHETFTTNAQQMCEMLKHMNLTNDPELDAARRKLEEAINGVDISAIRESPDVRAEVKSKVDNILKGYDWL